MRKTRDPNQLDLFGAAFAPQPKIKKEAVVINKPPPADLPKDCKSEKELIIWFAKHFKHSFAFVDCVLNGWLPGNYHGSKIWLRRLGTGWIDETIEDADYWIEKGYRIFESKQTISIIKLN